MSIDENFNNNALPAIIQSEIPVNGSLYLENDQEILYFATKAYNYIHSSFNTWFL